ncbi:glycosyltransferase family 4 protein [Aestuariispira insulae]|uniref:Glycosyltransferase involved in cell wall biosynthesis n=1 Tax=Aestuariispira insulae TaxID=1461337 RepID=A0A3D9H5C6_9PROT|nr:glycosyltransferase family 4 protein [Aestuariispira insulae]RED44680.1 glycosyltransferase involved in cell wall biosynthesis [Aestuariispira insulae]
MGDNVSLRGKTILYLVTEDWYFWSHRLPVARAAKQAGARVVVATRVNDHGDRIRAEGFELADIPFDRSGLNPVRDSKTLMAVLRLYRQVQPNLVHHVALKPALYGAIAAWRAGVPAVVNAMAGMGFMFISDSPKVKILRPVIKLAFRLLNNRRCSRLILQNGDDKKLFMREMGVRPDHIRVIRGSGVDLARFSVRPEPVGTPVAVCVSRMLWDKGIGELVEAARILRKRNAPVTIRLVGPTDDNPASIPQGVLDRWAAEGVVEVLGPSNDIAAVYADAHIAVLPSYREGLPKSLLEAAACGRPMVATDVPGCREVCREGETGLLVPLKSTVELADALEKLANSPDLRRAMGAAARNAAETEFADTIIAAETMELYQELV